MEEGYLDEEEREGQWRHGKWTKEEDDLLREAVQTFGEGRWRQVSALVPSRSPIQCLHRWTKILRPGLVKGPWTSAEDELLKEWVKNHGPTSWSEASAAIVGRSGKQCRERWFNTLSPDVKRGDWTEEEDLMIIREYEKLGPKWTQIAKALPGRTDNSIKNRYYATLRKVLSHNPSRPTSVSSAGAESSSSEDEAEAIRLLQRMQALEVMLSNTKLQVMVAEESIDNEVQRHDQSQS